MATDNQLSAAELETEGLPANPTAVQTATWARQQRFLDAYAVTGGVYKSAEIAECSPRVTQNWLVADDFAFQKRFQDAQARFLERLATEADRRAIEGVAKPVYQGGKRVGTVQQYSDNLLMFRMKRLDPAYRDNYTIVLDDRDVKGILEAMREAGTPRVVEGTAKIVPEPPQPSPEEVQPL